MQILSQAGRDMMAPALPGECLAASVSSAGSRLTWTVGLQIDGLTPLALVSRPAAPRPMETTGGTPRSSWGVPGLTTYADVRALAVAAALGLVVGWWLGLRRRRRLQRLVDDLETDVWRARSDEAAAQTKLQSVQREFDAVLRRVANSPFPLLVLRDGKLQQLSRGSAPYLRIPPVRAFLSGARSSVPEGSTVIRLSPEEEGVILAGVGPPMPDGARVVGLARVENPAKLIPSHVRDALTLLNHLRTPPRQIWLLKWDPRAERSCEILGPVSNARAKLSDIFQKEEPVLNWLRGVRRGTKARIAVRLAAEKRWVRPFGFFDARKDVVLVALTDATYRVHMSTLRPALRRARDELATLKMEGGPSYADLRVLLHEVKNAFGPAMKGPNPQAAADAVQTTLDWLEERAGRRKRVVVRQLGEAIDHAADAARQAFGITVRVQRPGPDGSLPFTDRDTANLLRVSLYEVLTNAAKHAKPAPPFPVAVEIVIQPDGDSVRIVAEDNGQAFNPGKVQWSGLARLREMLRGSSLTIADPEEGGRRGSCRVRLLVGTGRKR
jgi:hypothetical protein